MLQRTIASVSVRAWAFLAERFEEVQSLENLLRDELGIEARVPDHGEGVTIGAG